jgi:flagellar M-ring protein FliF
VQKDTTPVYPQGSSAGETIKQESGTYAVTKHVVHSEMEPGRLRRVTAAIVVNDRATLEGAGRQQHTVWRARSADEMHRMEELAEASIGYNPKRGDQVVLENLSFSGNAQAAPPTLLDRVLEQVRDLLQTQPGLLRTLMMGAFGVLIVLFVLRPVARQITAKLIDPPLLTTTAPSSPSIMESTAPWPAGLEDGAQEDGQSESWPRGRSSAQIIFDRVSDHIRREPMQSTRLLESWISSPENTNPS